jgi:hypothetical protein
VERSPHGRHTAGESWQAVAKARSRKRTKATRSVWVIALGGAVALVAAAFTFAGGGRQAVQFTANDTQGPLLGASVSNITSLPQDTAMFGHLPIVRVYYPGLPASNAWTGGLAGANKSAVIVSFKALPKDILSGSDDAALKHFFDTAPTGHPIYYTYWHEPEDNISAGQFNLADYKAAWAHVVALADAAHNPDLHSTEILMSYDLAPASHRNWRDYLPGGNVISVLAWDAYPVGSANNINPQPTPPADFMSKEIAASKSVGLPYGFAEFGLSTPNGRPGWLKAVGDYLMSSGALFGSLFNGTSEFPTLKLTDQASQSEWRGFVARSGSGNPGPGPTTTPTPKPTPTQTSTPKPTPTQTSTPPPTDTGPGVNGLALSPAALTASGQNHTVIRFSLNQAADVTVLVLDDHGTVVRTLIRPTHGAGKLTIPYYGYNGSGQREPAGSYRVLVVASNASGTGTAETPLTIDAP